MKPLEEMTGLELREACAIEVMGWTRDEDGWDDHGRLVVDEPWFESSIEAAFQVVEKMRERGYWCEMRNDFTKAARADCWAGFTPLGVTGWNGVPDNWTCADTLPLAICRAALKAARAK